MLSVFIEFGHLFHEVIVLKSGLFSNFEVLWAGTSNFLLVACLVLAADRYSWNNLLMFSELLFWRALCTNTV